MTKERVEGGAVVCAADVEETHIVKGVEDACRLLEDGNASLPRRMEHAGLGEN